MENGSNSKKCPTYFMIFSAYNIIPKFAKLFQVLLIPVKGLGKGIFVDHITSRYPSTDSIE